MSSGFNSFQMKRTGPETQLAQMGLGMTSGPPRSKVGNLMKIGKKRVISEESYFEDDNAQDPDNLEYIPAPGSPSYNAGENTEEKEKEIDSDESDDPLDAFMAGIENEVKKQEKASSERSNNEKDKKRGIRDDLENEDELESYMRYMEENPMAGVIQADDEFLEYDEEGNVIIPEKNKFIDPLPPIDHWAMDYEKFSKDFYIEHEQITELSQEKVQELRQKLGIRVSGFDPPKPVSSFAHFGFDSGLMNAILKSEFTIPTPIQAQGIPVALSGRDIIGIAKTGSGKTNAYLWPLLVHIMDQPALKAKEGPIGLILAPTRELSQQIYVEAKKFGKIYNINVACVYGGGSMWEQQKACEEGVEIIVATPGRLIDLIKKRSTNLTRVTYVVYDEADRMFDMGFEPQVRSIANHIRPDRQTLLFSATFKRKVERLARDILSDPVRVLQGDLGEANEDVTQIVFVMPPGPAKWSWLLRTIVGFTSAGSVLIFVTRKANSMELSKNLKENDHKVCLLHGDMEQIERNQVISSFKKQEIPILVATDVAARGLDIPHIRTVINYDVARDIDTHTHRIGRTGRAGTKGTAYTLITEKDKDFAGHLVRNLESSNQNVPDDLLSLAQQNPWFKKSRFKKGRAKNLNVGGKGLGFRERPGLGASESDTSNKSSTNRGPQSDRVSTMKMAFSAQYKSNFVSATNNEVWQGQEGAIHAPLSQQPPSPPRPSRTLGLGDGRDKKRKKRTRWE